jgi:hypothetical protein
VVGPRGWITDPAEIEPHLVEAGRLYRGEPAVEIALMRRVKRAPDPDNIMTRQARQRCPPRNDTCGVIASAAKQSRRWEFYCGTAGTGTHCVEQVGT